MTRARFFGSCPLLAGVRLNRERKGKCVMFLKELGDRMKEDENVSDPLNRSCDAIEKRNGTRGRN